MFGLTVLSMPIDEHKVAAAVVDIAVPIGPGLEVDMPESVAARTKSEIRGDAGTECGEADESNGFLHDDDIAWAGNRGEA